MLCKVTHCAGRVSANTRPHQLRWGDREMGTAIISCVECSQVAGLIQKVGRDSSKSTVSSCSCPSCSCPSCSCLSFEDLAYACTTEDNVIGGQRSVGIAPPSLPPHHSAVQQPGTSSPPSRLKRSSTGVIWMCKASFTNNPCPLPWWSPP